MSESATTLKTKFYANKRYIMYAIVTVVALIMPFIRINGNHLFLLNFDHKQFQLFFTTFDMQELFVMPFFLITMFLVIFFMTTLGGRVFCGWVCPQTIFRVIYRDLIQTKMLGIRKTIKNKQQVVEGDMPKRIIGALIWVVLSFIAAANFMWFFVPPEDFFSYLQNPAEHGVMVGAVVLIAAFLIYDVLILQEKWCIYICPYARIQSVMFDNDTIQTVYNPNRGGVLYDQEGNKLGKKPLGENDECTGCEACVRVCPTHIDIRKGMQLECINCLECADACTKVMNKLGKSSLITWTSEKEAIEGEKTQYFRFRIVGYMVAICIAFGMLLFMSGKKETMLLNINRTTQLYKVTDEGKLIENPYIFLFQNTDRKDHKYYFTTNNPDIKVLRPKEGFNLKAGKKIKKIVILGTTKRLTQDNIRGDKPLDIVVKAYATDAKDKIFVDRKAVFVYPKQAVIDKKRNK